MVHDLDESLSGDIARDFKHFDAEIQKEIRRVSLLLMDKAYPNDVAYQVKKAKQEPKSVEALMVMLADELQPFLKVYGETGGNRSERITALLKRMIEVVNHSIEYMLKTPLPTSLVGILEDLEKELKVIEDGCSCKENV